MPAEHPRHGAQIASLPARIHGPSAAVNDALAGALTRMAARPLRVREKKGAGQPGSTARLSAGPETGRGR